MTILHCRNSWLIGALCVIFFSTAGLAQAADSGNYSLDQEVSPLSGASGNSANYQFDAVIGLPGAGQSSSQNYIFDHGFSWLSNIATATPTSTPPEPEIIIPPTGSAPPPRSIIIQVATSGPDIIIPRPATTSPETPEPPIITEPIVLPPCPPTTDKTADEIIGSDTEQVCQQPTASTTRPTSFPTQIKSQLQTVNDFVAQQISRPNNWYFYIISLLIIISVLMIIFRKRRK